MQVENQQQLRVRLTLLVQTVVSINSCPAGGVLDGLELQPYYIGVLVFRGTSFIQEKKMTKCVSNSHDKTHLHPCKFYFDVLLNGTKPNCEGNVKKQRRFI